MGEGTLERYLVLKQKSKHFHRTAFQLICLLFMISHFSEILMFEALAATQSCGINGSGVWMVVPGQLPSGWLWINNH